MAIFMTLLAVAVLVAVDLLVKLWETYKFNRVRSGR